MERYVFPFVAKTRDGVHKLCFRDQEYAHETARKTIEQEDLTPSIKEVNEDKIKMVPEEEGVQIPQVEVERKKLRRSP